MRLLLIIAVAAAIGFSLLLSDRSVSGEILRFKLCSHVTGKSFEEFRVEGINTLGVMHTEASSVSAVIPLGIKDCVMIMMKNGDQAVVVGTLNQIMCAWKRGCWCESSEE